MGFDFHMKITCSLQYKTCEYRLTLTVVGIDREWRGSQCKVVVAEDAEGDAIDGVQLGRHH